MPLCYSEFIKCCMKELSSVGGRVGVRLEHVIDEAGVSSSLFTPTSGDPQPKRRYWCTDETSNKEHETQHTL